MAKLQNVIRVANKNYGRDKFQKCSDTKPNNSRKEMGKIYILKSKECVPHNNQKNSKLYVYVEELIVNKDLIKSVS